MANIERSFKTINQIVIKAKSIFIAMSIVVKFHSEAGETQDIFASKSSKVFLSYKASYLKANKHRTFHYYSLYLNRIKNVVSKICSFIVDSNTKLS